MYSPQNEKQKAEIERLRAALAKTEKVVQLLILLGLKTLPGCEGNDAVDENGEEYELNTKCPITLRPRIGWVEHLLLSLFVPDPLQFPAFPALCRGFRES